MDRRRKLAVLRAKLGAELITKGDEFVFPCMRRECSSHKKGSPKLSVNLSDDRFHCWVCGFSGNNLLPFFERNSPERREYLEHLGIVHVSDEKKEYDDPTLPREFRTLSVDWGSFYQRVALDYLYSRGMTFDDILYWKLGYCEEGEMKNRIIIPSFDEGGNLNFAVGRSFYEGEKRRYKHGNFSKDIIWNDLMVDWSKPVHIVEGPFDAFRVRDNVVALQGSILNKNSKLFSRLVLSGNDVFFALDGDAFRNQMKMIQELTSYGIRCWSIPLSGFKDVAEMTSEQFSQAKRDAKLVDGPADLLRLRVFACH